VIYDHFAKRFRTALDGYVDCVLAADPGPEEFESLAGAIDERASTDVGHDVHRRQFEKAVADLENRRS
jgi:hypothetical protein